MLRKLLLGFSVLTALALSAQTSSFVPDPKFGELYGQRATLFDQLGVRSDNIVMLGNSLTHGCEWRELLGNPLVVNRGINGDTAEGIYQRLGSVLRGQPAKIFLLTGVNDVSHDLSAEEVVEGIVKVLLRIREESPSTRVYLQSLLPINQSFERYHRLDGKEDVIREINRLLQLRAAELGVTWINLYPHFTDGDGNLRRELTNDGLHLLGPGYLIWREQIMRYINE